MVSEMTNPGSRVVGMKMVKVLKRVFFSSRSYQPHSFSSAIFTWAVARGRRAHVVRRSFVCF